MDLFIMDKVCITYLAEERIMNYLYKPNQACHKESSHYVYDKYPLVEHLSKLLFQETRKNMAQLFLVHMEVFFLIYSKSKAKLNPQQNYFVNFLYQPLSTSKAASYPSLVNSVHEKAFVIFFTTWNTWVYRLR